MSRCIELARKGAGTVAPNPMVGAVLVKNGIIIGEGWHRQFGQAHAEVHACNSIAGLQPDQQAGAGTVLYVSLEPCAHVGKTPPCADLIIRLGIPKVVIGCRDPFPAVNGKGIEKLRAAGIEVVTGVLEDQCRELNKRFFTFYETGRPYVILKWAQTADGIIGNAPGNPERLLISQPATNRIVHQWRSEEAAILTGRNTALLDNPALTNRLYSGPSPVRMVIDSRLQLPDNLQLFDGSAPTIVWNFIREEERGNLRFIRLDKAAPVIPQLLRRMQELQLQSLLVEGGRQLLQSFIDSGYWDEARVITNPGMIAGTGISAPVLPPGIDFSQSDETGDRIAIIQNNKKP